MNAWIGKVWQIQKIFLLVLYNSCSLGLILLFFFAIILYILVGQVMIVVIVLV